MSDKPRFFDVFYRDYRHEVSISSAAPEPLDAARLAPLAEKLLESPDNFFGVVDGAHNILQFYLDDSAGPAEAVVCVELLPPDGTDGSAVRLSLTKALKLLANLPSTFDQQWLRAAQ